MTVGLNTPGHNHGFARRAVQSHWWTVAIIALVVSLGLGLALYVNTNTTRVRNALATEVLQQQRDVALLIQEYSNLMLAVDRQWTQAGEDNLGALDSVIDAAHLQLFRMRSTYSFARLDGAAKAHAFAKPVLEDVEQWLASGIPGYPPEDPFVYEMASKRLQDRYAALRDIAAETDAVATSLIVDQTGFLSKFRDSLIFLLGAYALVALGIAALLIRQRNLQARIAHDRQHHAERFSDFAEAGADWFWETDAFGRIQNASEPKKTASGSTVGSQNHLTADHLPLELMSTHQPFQRVESRFRTDDGQEHIISMSGKPRFSEGTFVGYRGVGRDITLRKRMEYDLQQANNDLLNAESRGRQQAEQALQESEKFMRTALDALPANLAILNEDGIIMAANRAWKNLVAQSIVSEQEGGVGFHFLDIYQKRSHDEFSGLREVEAKIDKVLKGVNETFEQEISYSLDSENKRWMLIHLTTFGRGETLYTVLIHENITERRQLEQRDRILRTELAQAGRLATAGELASGLAHELNQPLTAISHNCDALLFGIRQLPVKEKALSETAQDIYELTQRAGNIIRGMRQLVSKGPSQATSVELNDLVKETLRLTNSDAYEQDINIILELTENLPQVTIDPVQIQQVLVNLERNAVEAIASVAAGTRDLRISTNYSPGDREILISIADSGPGISETMKTQLFTAFKTTKEGGMGLGLSISRSIVEAHGGRLWVDLDNKTGTIFHFTIPVSKG